MSHLSHKSKIVVACVGLVTAGVVVWLFVRAVSTGNPGGAREGSAATRPAGASTSAPSRSEDAEQSNVEWAADDGLLPEIDIEQVLMDAKKRAHAQREQRRAAVAKAETIPQLVKGLMHETCDVGDPIQDFRMGHVYLRTFSANPRVRRLMSIAEEGAKAEVAQAANHIRQMLDRYVSRLPDFYPEGQPWKPSVMSPGGAVAYPFLLARMGQAVSSMPLLVRVYLRHQEAIRKYYKAESPDWWCSKFGMVLAYACEQAFAEYGDRPELRRSLTDRQRKILKDYEVHRRSRSKDWNLGIKQCRVMEFAVPFVKGKREDTDQTRR